MNVLRITSQRGSAGISYTDRLHSKGKMFFFQKLGLEKPIIILESNLAGVIYKFAKFSADWL